MNEQVSQTFSDNVAAIDQKLDQLQSDKRRAIRLLSQAALFVACQPENKFRNKWLEEVQELIDG